MQFLCKSNIARLFRGQVKNRKAHLMASRDLLRHQSVACLLADGAVAAFPTVNRNEDLLAEKPPIITLQFGGETGIANSLFRLRTAMRITVAQIDTVVFE
jgi:hypothetical protein